tara:strand:- start:5610 stop:6308 length:699 start_codon:yes stop_codon:yes gene_type:complete
MRFESKLCFSNDVKSIVKIEAWEDEVLLGSALGENINAEIAEDRAINRFNDRFKKTLISNNINSKNHFNNTSKVNNKDIKTNCENKDELNKSVKNDQKKDSDDYSDDWSKELILIQNELERLKWDRDTENKYIKSILGYSNKNKITKYSDIKTLIESLKKMPIENDYNSFNREELIVKSDSILLQLHWNKDKGRDFLINNFNLSSRQELKEDQLLRFINLLENELKKQKLKY